MNRTKNQIILAALSTMKVQVEILRELALEKIQALYGESWIGLNERDPVTHTRILRKAQTTWKEEG